MGPWYHGQWNRDEGNKLGDITFGSNTSTWFQENVQLPFFNYYLKGKELCQMMKQSFLKRCKPVA